MPILLLLVSPIMLVLTAAEAKKMAAEAKEMAAEPLEEAIVEVLSPK